MQYVPLVENVADASSRSISYTDSMLSEVVWAKVEEYGPHTVVLMALDDNAIKAEIRQLFRHFTPCPMSFFAGSIFLCKT